MGKAPRKLWQEKNGPIPDGYKLIYLDGDRNNCDLENLALAEKQPHYEKITVGGKRYKKHIWVWEQENGPVPEGYVVHHKDGNIFNNKLDNLEVLAWGGHTSLHGETTYPKRVEAGRKVGLSNRKQVPEGEAWCFGCQQSKHITEFTKSKNHWNGLDPLCKICKKERRKR